MDGTEGRALVTCDSVKNELLAEIDQLTINDTKNPKSDNSSLETNMEPYQKIKAMTQKPIDWERE